MLVKDLKDPPIIGTRVFNNEKTQTGVIDRYDDDLKEIVHIQWENGKDSSWYWALLELEIVEAPEPEDSGERLAEKYSVKRLAEKYSDAVKDKGFFTALYRDNINGKEFCVMTRDDPKDVTFIEEKLRCTFVKVIHD